MTAKIINLMQYLIENRDESLGAVKRVLQRPFPSPRELTGKPETEEEAAQRVAAWFLEGLWMEGFRVVRVTDDE